jgi:hypothetical protein
VLELISTQAAMNILTDLAEGKGDDYLSVLAREKMARRGEPEAPPAPSTRPMSGPAR